MDENVVLERQPTIINKQNDKDVGMKKKEQFLNRRRNDNVYIVFTLARLYIFRSFIIFLLFLALS